MNRRCLVATALVAAFACGPAFAQFAPREISPPKEMAWTTYDTGSSGFNIATAISQQLEQAHGWNARILPSGNDTGRLAPIKANRAVLSQMGIGVYYAQEGVYEFGAKSWGPQAVRLLMAGNSCYGLSLAVAKDTGATQIKDLKGKRLGVVVGSPALSQGALALLAFGGLGENDVARVQYASNNSMWKGLINNEVDIALTSTISGQAKEAAASPRGIVWPPLPAADTAGWARVHKKAPYFMPAKATCGAGGLSPQAPVEMASYAYPIFMTFADRKADVIFPITKAMIDGFNAYKDAAEGAEGMALSLQNFRWVVPYHEGSISAFKEKGVWTEAAQKRNDGLVRRQGVLMDTWKLFSAGGPVEEQAFAERWMKTRAAALAKAGLDPVFE